MSNSLQQRSKYLADCESQILVGTAGCSRSLRIDVGQPGKESREMVAAGKQVRAPASAGHVSDGPGNALLVDHTR